VENAPHNVKESFKKFLDQNPETADVQNLNSSSLSQTDLQPNFHKNPIITFYVKLITEKQTQKMADKT